MHPPLSLSPLSLPLPCISPSTPFRISPLSSYPSLLLTYLSNLTHLFLFHLLLHALPPSPLQSSLSSLQVPPRLNGTIGPRYRINYTSDTDRPTRARIVYISRQQLNASTLNATILGLQRGTEYMFQVRLEMRYPACYSYFYGNYSEPIFVSTNATSEEFYIRTRLCSFASLPTIYTVFRQAFDN